MSLFSVLGFSLSRTQPFISTGELCGLLIWKQTNLRINLFNVEGLLFLPYY